MVNVAVLGFGVVGSGTVEVIDKNAAQIKKSAGQDITVKYILDIREFPASPYSGLIVKDFETIRSDPEVTVVVETIGGAGAALEFTKACLTAGKSVVTSNKELVAAHGSELLKLALEKGVNYLFEASVGGGIPIVRPIAQCISGNIIGEIYGILNGTTNYILTEMEKNGAEFKDALADAQKKGYAEADPTNDIDGHDACRKICILSSLAGGRHVYPDFVPTEGIKGVTADDIGFSSKMGYKIKLLARARIHDGKVAAYVAPHLVGRDHIISRVDGVMNCVVVRGNAVGDLTFIGAGAGKMPTASAVVADVIDSAKHMHTRRLIGWDCGGEDVSADPSQLESSWYIRSDAKRGKIEHEFGEVIFADGTGNVTAFKTAFMSGNKVRQLLDRGIPALSLIRILGDH